MCVSVRVRAHACVSWCACINKSVWLSQHYHPNFYFMSLTFLRSSLLHRWDPSYPHNSCQCDCCKPKDSYPNYDCTRFTGLGKFGCNFYYDSTTYSNPCKWACGWLLSSTWRGNSLFLLKWHTYIKTICMCTLERWALSAFSWLLPCNSCYKAALNFDCTNNQLV